MNFRQNCTRVPYCTLLTVNVLQLCDTHGGRTRTHPRPRRRLNPKCYSIGSKVRELFVRHAVLATLYCEKKRSATWVRGWNCFVRPECARPRIRRSCSGGWCKPVFVDWESTTLIRSPDAFRIHSHSKSHAHIRASGDLVLLKQSGCTTLQTGFRLFSSVSSKKERRKKTGLAFVEFNYRSWNYCCFRKYQLVDVFENKRTNFVHGWFRVSFSYLLISFTSFRVLLVARKINT